MKFILLSCMTIFSVGAFAAKMDAGCFDPTGVERNNVLSQSGKTFTNATSSPITATAMLLGTSGCKTNGFVREDKEAGVFLATHVDEIKGELASGSGEYISAFGDLVGCTGQTERVTSSLKSSASPLVHHDFSDARVEKWLSSLHNECQI